MSKTYKYHVTLEANFGNATSIISRDIEIDHQFSGADALSREKLESDGLWKYCVVSVIPSGVTGDFTYLVHYKTEQVGNEPEQSSIMVTLDHKITTKSFNKDVINIAKMIFDIDEDDFETEIPTTEILNFQEISEE